MKMFKCSHCGKVFEEVGTYKDGHDTWCCCPECGCDYYEEAVKCEVCGEWVLESELFYGVCEDCKNNFVNEYKYKPIECYKLAGSEKETVELNALLVSLFTPEQIESALLRVISEADGYFDIDCSNFIKSDIVWFIETVKGVK